MYLSLLELNTRSRQVQAELRDPYQMHRTISKAFADDENTYKSARCLFRVDESRDGRVLYTLVQSKLRPDWEKWTVSADYLAADTRVKDFTPVVRLGQRLGFRLRANPTVKRDGKRWGLEKEEEQLQWLARKGQEGGFRVISASVGSDGKLLSPDVLGKDGKLLAVLFNGILEITDVGVFLLTLEKGIGSAKGFGFGLLSITPMGR